MFSDYSMLVTLYKIGEVHFRLIGADGFHVRDKNERFTAAGSRCRQNLKYVIWQTTSQNCTKKRAARAARLCFPYSTSQIIDL